MNVYSQNFVWPLKIFFFLLGKSLGVRVSGSNGSRIKCFSSVDLLNFFSSYLNTWCAVIVSILIFLHIYVSSRSVSFGLFFFVMGFNSLLFASLIVLIGGQAL